MPTIYALSAILLVAVFFLAGLAGMPLMLVLYHVG